MMGRSSRITRPPLREIPKLGDAAAQTLRPHTLQTARTNVQVLERRGRLVRVPVEVAPPIRVRHPLRLVQRGDSGPGSEHRSLAEHVQSPTRRHRAVPELEPEGARGSGTGVRAHGTHAAPPRTDATPAWENRTTGNGWAFELKLGSNSARTASTSARNAPGGTWPPSRRPRRRSSTWAAT